jgi:hypothetical protein
MEQKAKTSYRADRTGSDDNATAVRAECALERLHPLRDGLAPATVERMLHLAPGAWGRRRLYALRVRTADLSVYGVAREDVLIAEPGAREQPGQLVLVRSEGRLELFRLPVRPTPRAGQTPSLPFPSVRRVVATVIARIPAATLERRPGRLAEARAAAQAIRRQRMLTLTQRLACWRQDHPAAGLGRSQRWHRLEQNLSTLLECARRSHGARMTDALLDQAEAVAKMMGQEARNARQRRSAA